MVKQGNICGKTTSSQGRLKKFGEITCLSAILLYIHVWDQPYGIWIRVSDLVPSPMSCALHSISLLDKINFVLFHFISFFLHFCLVFYFMVFLGWENVVKWIHLWETTFKNQSVPLGGHERRGESTSFPWPVPLPGGSKVKGHENEVAEKWQNLSQ